MLNNTETSIIIDSPIHEVWCVLENTPKFENWSSRTWFSSSVKSGALKIMRVTIFGFWFLVFGFQCPSESRNFLYPKG